MPVPLISVIDDDRSVRVSIDSLVRSLGWRARQFETVEDFLASGAANETDCVVSDIELPGGMSGIDLAAHLASAGRPPLILISGRLGAEGDMLARDAGAVCFLRKPFSGDRLIDCLSAALAA